MKSTTPADSEERRDGHSNGPCSTCEDINITPYITRVISFGNNTERRPKSSYKPKQRRRHSTLISTLDDDTIAAADVNSLARRHIATATDGGSPTVEEARVGIASPIQGVLPMLAIGRRN